MARPLRIEGAGLLYHVISQGKARSSIYLDDDDFVEDMRSLLDPDKSLVEVPSAQRRKIAESLSLYVSIPESRNESIIRAWESGGYKMKGIADYLDLHYSTVSKIISNSRNSRFKT